MPKTRPRGRPPEGPHDVRVRDLARRTLRWRAVDEARLLALTVVEQRNPWEVLRDALNSYMATLDGPTRELVTKVAKRRVRTVRERFGDAS